MESRQTAQDRQRKKDSVRHADSARQTARCRPVPGVLVSELGVRRVAGCVLGAPRFVQSAQNA
jgi:hypothetical protein